MNQHFCFTFIFGTQERTGYMAANRGASTMQNLKVVYGAMPETLKPEYAKTETFIKHLQVRNTFYSLIRAGSL